MLRETGTARVRLAGYRRLGANGNAQYQFDRHTAVGGSFSAYQTRNDAGTAGGGQSRSLYGSAFYQTRFFDWPRSRFMLTVRRNELIVLGDSSATGQEVQWEQDWAGARQATLRSELTTTLGYARDRSGGMSRNYPTAGLQWRGSRPGWLRPRRAAEPCESKDSSNACSCSADRDNPLKANTHGSPDR